MASRIFRQSTAAEERPCGPGRCQPRRAWRQIAEASLAAAAECEESATEAAAAAGWNHHAPHVHLQMQLPCWHLPTSLPQACQAEAPWALQLQRAERLPMNLNWLPSEDWRYRRIHACLAP